MTIVPTHETISYRVQAVQWIKGTTTIEQVQAVWSTAYADANGDLWLSRDGMTATVIADQSWVYVDQGNALNITTPDSFAAQYVPIP